MNDKTERITSADYQARGASKKTADRIVGVQQQSVRLGATQIGGTPIIPASRTVASLYIGLDPGCHTGFALWQARTHGIPGQFLEVSTLTFWSAIRRMEKLVREFGAAALHVRIEDVRANKPTFSDKVGNARVRENISQKVGSNKRDCQLLIEWIEHAGIPYTALPPRKRATGKGKVTAEFFKGVKGFPNRSTEHSRDASALVIDL